MEYGLWNQSNNIPASNPETIPRSENTDFVNRTSRRYYTITVCKAYTTQIGNYKYGGEITRCRVKDLKSVK